MASYDPISDTELHAMRQRADAASKAPWEAFVAGPGDSFSSMIRIGGVHGNEPDMYLSREDWYSASDADLRFIAAARQDVPRLIAEVQRLRRELDLANRPK